MSTTITFSEQALSTIDPIFRTADNTVSFFGRISMDDAQPTSPVLGGRSSFYDPVEWKFDSPVSSLEFDAGYFNSTGTTIITFYSSTGLLLYQTSNDRIGIEHFRFTTNGAGIGRVSVVSTGSDQNGFAVDNVTFSGEPLIPTSQIFARYGDLGFLGLMAQAAYCERTPLNNSDGYALAKVDSQIHLLTPSDFGTYSNTLTLNSAGDGLKDGLYIHKNAAALIGRSQDSVFISFRGTQDAADVADDVLGFTRHWSQFTTLTAALSNYVNDPSNHIQNVYVAGHSLGGAMAQAFMQYHEGDGRYHAATFGSPGYYANSSTAPRIVNLANDGDRVPLLSSVAGTQISGEQVEIIDGLAGLLPSHSAALYSAEASYLSTYGMSLDGLTNSDSSFDCLVVPGHQYGDDFFSIGDQSELIAGSSGRDVILPGAGSDYVNGYDGLDTVVLNTSISTVSISHDNSWIWWNVQSPEGSDYLRSVERIRCDDATIALDVQGNAGIIYRLYQAAFDRVPDQTGLRYWINQVDRGVAISEVAASFVVSQEFRDQYSAFIEASSIVNRLYLNILDRVGDLGGVSYWVNQLERGLPLPAVLLGFSESGETHNLVDPQLQHGIIFDLF